KACPLARTVAPVPSGESPDQTGGSPNVRDLRRHAEPFQIRDERHARSERHGQPYLHARPVRIRRPDAQLARQHHHSFRSMNLPNERVFIFLSCLLGELASGWKMLGSGIDVTVLKIAEASIPGAQYWPIGN